MNYLLLPDFLAMSLLVAVLPSLGKRRPNRDGVRLWIVGLMLILAECAARIIYTMPNITLAVHRACHVISLDAYLVAGVLFLLSASSALRSMPRRNFFLWANTLPLLALMTIYGSDNRTLPLYYLCAAVGVVMGVISCAVTRRNCRYYAVVALLWISVIVATAVDEYRSAVYICLFVIYLLCAVAFHHSLPKGSRGKIAVVAGFTMWAFCFLSHPWLRQSHPEWAEFASELWNMQKFIITVGLLVVMLEQQLQSSEWLALHDELTGLANRRGFDEHLQNAFLRTESEPLRVALFSVDLDGFKQINDTLGHDAGDILLRQVAAHLKQAVGHAGMLARLGGDEFAMIAIDSAAASSSGSTLALGDDPQFQSIQADLLKAIQQPVSLGPAYDNRIVTISASIGMAVFPVDTAEGTALMRLADARMYEQKNRRRNRRHDDPLPPIQSLQAI